jgi:hypothetical protein
VAKPYEKMTEQEKKEIRDKLWQSGQGLTKKDKGKENDRIKEAGF